MKYDYNWDTMPIYFKTEEAAIESRKGMELRLLNDRGWSAGGISLRFTDPMQYRIEQCQVKEFSNFSESLPAELAKEWILERTSETNITIYCNGLTKIIVIVYVNRNSA